MFHIHQLSYLLDLIENTSLFSSSLLYTIYDLESDMILLHGFCSVQVNCLCELGIYGIFLCDSNANAELPSATSPSDTLSGISAPYINRYGGYLLRVKPAVSDEGGVAAGYAVLSSPDLV